MLAVTISSGEAILIIVFATIPIAAFSFINGAGNALREIGKGPFAIEQELPPKPGQAAPAVSPEVREAELRQLLEGKAYRQRSRGAEPLDVDVELQRILAAERAPATNLAGDPALVAEVRDLVVARNDRRLRQGKDPLDIEAEIARQLRDLEGLGQ